MNQKYSGNKYTINCLLHFLFHFAVDFGNDRYSVVDLSERSFFILLQKNYKNVIFTTVKL